MAKLAESPLPRHVALGPRLFQNGVGVLNCPRDQLIVLGAVLEVPSHVIRLVDVSTRDNSPTMTRGVDHGLRSFAVRNSDEVLVSIAAVPQQTLCAASG
jgi:hypothetical protein